MCAWVPGCPVGQSLELDVQATLTDVDEAGPK